MTKLITYATESFWLGARVLRASALRNSVDAVEMFSPADISKEFRLRNSDILSRPRGAGYWIWKPWFIQTVLTKMNPDDVLIWCDSGIEIISDLQPLIQIAKNSEVPVIVSDFCRTNREWTKRDAFVLMDVDLPEYYETTQIACNFTLWRNTEDAQHILSEWLRYMEDTRISTDDPDVCGLPALDGFVENRHDQSVLSLLAAKYKIPIYRDPSGFGDLWKGVVDVGTLRPPNWKVSTPMAASPYGTLLNVHRFRNKQPSQILWLLRRWLFWRLSR